jgi:hypothetical protein
VPEANNPLSSFRLPAAASYNIFAGYGTRTFLTLLLNKHHFFTFWAGGTRLLAVNSFLQQAWATKALPPGTKQLGMVSICLHGSTLNTNSLFSSVPVLTATHNAIERGLGQ